MSGFSRPSIIVFCLIGAMAAGPPVAQASKPIAQIHGKVVRVADGDSITVLTGEKKIEVRLGQIDAPEKDQDWADAARAALREKVQGKIVTVQVTDIDRHGRAVGKVQRASRDINRELVREGHAWVYRRYLTDESLLADEAQAIESRRGLWRYPAPVAPWDWRRGARRAVAASDQTRATSTSPTSPTSSTPSHRCGSKTYCREMDSCAQARFYLNSCGLSRLDGDKDGVPCESLCGR